MALRLTANTLATPAPAENSLLSSPAALADAARAALAIGEVGTYRRLTAEVAGVADLNRRYHLRCRLVEAAFAASPTISAPAAREALVLAADVALSGLEESPSEPLLLNLAGVALYELWSLDPARALFKAALSLDPSLPFARANLTALGARGRQRNGMPLHPSLPELARRAKAVAAKAKPAAGLTLSLVMIVKDEEEMLPRCLAAAAPIADEIVIVDTGSTDGTVQIAESFGARVLHHEWNGSFADARNVSFDAATSDWILYLDADEVLVAEDLDKLRELTRRSWREAFYFSETNFTGEVGDGLSLTHNALRMFRNRPEYRFSGRLHEQIISTLPNYTPERVEHSGVRIEHYGYLAAVRDAKEKSRRNIEILRAQMRESPDTPFLRFNLGSEYCATGEWAAAASEFERAWTMMFDGPYAYLDDYACVLASRMVMALTGSGRPAEAIAHAEECLEHFPGLTDLVYEQGKAARALGRTEDAIAYFERCLQMGEAPGRYTSTRGVGSYLAMHALADLLQGRGETDRAQALLDRCLQEHPDFYGTVLPYATLRLQSGGEPESVVAEIEERVAEMTPTIRFMLGTALYEAGASAAAEEQFRRVLAAGPNRVVVRVALGEALLSQSRWDEAAREAALVDAPGPLGAMAIRTELFARLAAGETDRVPQILGRSGEAGLPSNEMAVFAAWSEQLQDGTSTRTLAPGSADLIGVMLEALLRVQEFVGFERLLPLLSRCGLPERERLERLAGIYLRRGFLASAAEEWMAVCETTPDSRALVGLARVAAAHGLAEDAANFAGEALTVDPGCADARALLDHLSTV